MAKETKFKIVAVDEAGKQVSSAMRINTPGTNQEYCDASCGNCIIEYMPDEM